MKKIVITGGAGFIGSHIVDRFAALYPKAKIAVVDKMTYAADIRNISGHIEKGRVELIVGDVCSRHICDRAIAAADLVIHAAAESHVDNSFSNSLEFSRTNVEGTHSLMESCRQAKVKKIIHVSTDEVYGEIQEGAADENSHFNPTNPYSASKAAAEMIIGGYYKSFKIPVVIVRANNIFGTRQFPEKILPKFILLLATGQKLTIHGSGKNKRHYLDVHDFTAALDLISRKGKIGQAYNVGAIEEYTNMQVAHMVCDAFGVDPKKHIRHVKDRPFNDSRYSIDWDKLAALGWKPKHRLARELPGLARWYVENIGRHETRFPALKRRPKKKS